MHLHGRREREARTLAAMEMLAGLRAALEAQGLACPIVTGGGTGTFDMDPPAAILTDLQAGSYLFMDAQYAEVWEADRERAAAEGRSPRPSPELLLEAVLGGGEPGPEERAADAGPARRVAAFARRCGCRSQFQLASAGEGTR